MPPDRKKDDWIRLLISKGVYHVTDEGDIVRSATGYVLKQSAMKDGYRRVGLAWKGSVHYVKAHRVIAIAKHPNPDDKPMVNHKDGVKSNNHPRNLEWATALENGSHAVKSGLYQGVKGEKSVHAKLTQKQVDEIRSLYAKGSLSQRQIGLIFGVKQNTVSVILSRVNWT